MDLGNVLARSLDDAANDVEKIRLRLESGLDQYEVDDAGAPEGERPSLYAESDEFRLLHVDRKLVRASIDGSSPCVKDPDHDAR
jgi:hypothetical protein